MSPLRAATTGATTASASFSSAIGTPNLPIRIRAPANTINRCNSAGGKTHLAARRPHGRSESHSEELALAQRVRLPLTADVSAISRSIEGNYPASPLHTLEQML